MSGSYLNDESVIDINKKKMAVDVGAAGKNYVSSKEFSKKLNSKVDKDDHREALKNKENKI